MYYIVKKQVFATTIISLLITYSRIHTWIYLFTSFLCYYLMALHIVCIPCGGQMFLFYPGQIYLIMLIFENNPQPYEMINESRLGSTCIKWEKGVDFWLFQFTNTQHIVILQIHYAPLKSYLYEANPEPNEPNNKTKQACLY